MTEEQQGFNPNAEADDSNENHPETVNQEWPDKAEKVGGEILDTVSNGESRDQWGMPGSSYDSDGFVKTQEPLAVQAAEFQAPNDAWGKRGNDANYMAHASAASEARDTAATYRDMATLTPEGDDEHLRVVGEADEQDSRAESEKIAMSKSYEYGKEFVDGQVEATRRRLQKEYEGIVDLNPEVIGKLPVTEFLEIARELSGRKHDIEIMGRVYETTVWRVQKDIELLNVRRGSNFPAYLLVGYGERIALENEITDKESLKAMKSRLEGIAKSSLEVDTDTTYDAMHNFLLDVINVAQADLNKNIRDLQEYISAIKSGDIKKTEANLVGENRLEPAAV